MGSGVVRVTESVTGSVDELQRFEHCAKEPIRTPGMIQDHGILLGVDPSDSMIVLADERHAAWLGRSAAEFGGPQIEAAIRRGSSLDPLRVEVGGQTYDAIVHSSSGLSVFELEPSLSSLEYARTAVVGAIQRISSLRDRDAVRSAAVEELRSITGFDRVMVYYFHNDGHGEVVAESRIDELEPYLGLHFPASDIPPQARELYLTKLSRAIVSTERPGIPLVALEADAAALDLSQAELRSVSPYHLQFMRNMGQASTVSFSLVQDGRLAGMITCAHGTERRLPVLLRRAIEVLTSQLSLQLDSLEQIEQLTHAVAIRAERAELLSPLFASEDIASALFDGERTVLDLVPSDGAAVSIGGVVTTTGSVPPPDELAALLEALSGTTIASHALARDRADLSVLAPSVNGVLSIPLGVPGDQILFFRDEAVREVDWLGDMSESNRPDQLSPRVSFAAWKQSVVDTAMPWGRVADEALELGRELENAIQRRRERALAQEALRDPLTGLGNRRHLRMLLEQSLQAGGTDHGLSVLFVDIDRFKSVNDTHGHDAGDSVLIEIARRLTASVRPQDTIARLGGDEFVVLCEGVTAEQSRAIAERIVTAARAPIRYGTTSIPITVSCGIVDAHGEWTAADLLSRADSAMYRAKEAGRDSVSL
jgi:diguanylate cyclase (GGDEF)-like protein